MGQDILDYFPKNIPIVCDASSNFCSRSIDVSKFACIFAGAQKNIGPAGLVVVIIRKDLLEMERKLTCPLMMDYKVFCDSDSCYNTPPCFNIYVTGLVFKHLMKDGGIKTVSERNEVKSAMVYGMIAKYPAVYYCPVASLYRSRMNIPFRILVDGKANEAREKEFVNGAEKREMVQLAGHRSVGGIRASIYNAMSVGEVAVLIGYMEEFATGVVRW